MIEAQRTSTFPGKQWASGGGIGGGGGDVMAPKPAAQTLSTA